MEYTRAGLPWFDYYVEGRRAGDGGKELEGLKSVAATGAEMGGKPLPENTAVHPQNLITLRRGAAGAGAGRARFRATRRPGDGTSEAILKRRSPRESTDSTRGGI